MGEIVTRPFTPNFWLRNAHVQTLWGRFFRKSPPIELQQERWDTPDGDFLDLYRAKPRNGGADTPRVLILHGLEGTINSHYAKGFLSEFQSRGWFADLMVFRSCGNELNRARRFYHSGDTADIRFVIDKIARENPEQPLALVGVSLGGNVVLKYLGERFADKSESDISGVSDLLTQVPDTIVAAAAVSVPYDLGRGSRFISSGFSKIYERHFLESLKKKVRAKFVQYSDLLENTGWEEARTLFDFDDRVTAPLHGFKDANDYYERSSAIHYIRNIKTSTLLLSSFDDPFLPSEVLKAVEEIASSNDYLETEFSEHGGHVGFIEAGNPFNPQYYTEKRIGNYFADAFMKRLQP